MIYWNSNSGQLQKCFALLSGWFGIRKDFCQFLLGVCPFLQEYGNISYTIHNNYSENSHQQNSAPKAEKLPKKKSLHDEQPKPVLPVISIDMPDWVFYLLCGLVLKPAISENDEVAMRGVTVRLMGFLWSLFQYTSFILMCHSYFIPLFTWLSQYNLSTLIVKNLESRNPKHFCWIILIYIESRSIAY